MKRALSVGTYPNTHPQLSFAKAQFHGLHESKEALCKRKVRLMKPKKKEDQNVDASVCLKRENKIFTGGNTGTKNGAETEEKVIQRLPHLGIHPICYHQTQSPSDTEWDDCS